MISSSKCILLFVSLIVAANALPAPLNAPGDAIARRSNTPIVAPLVARDEPSFMKGTQTGEATFYDTGLGACGNTNKDTDFIAAVSVELFDNYPGFSKGDNPNTNPVCNKKVRATYQGKDVEVTIADYCESCGLTDLDFSPAAFKTIADPEAGNVSGMTWVWI